MTLIPLVLLIGYLLGSIPFGMVVSWIYGIDIRRYGSGNIGATNVNRVLGSKAGIAVFIADMLKGTFAVGLATIILSQPSWIILAGVAAVLGHMFSIFLGFKGGRGAATGLGVLLGITPDLFLFTLTIFVIIVAITRYVSVGSLTGAVCLTLLMFGLQKPLPYALGALLVTVLIIIKHIPNIERLMAGTEPKLGEKAKPKPQ